MENFQKSTHPLILIAAVSVSIASLAAAAHFTGLIPSRESAAPAPVLATAPTPAAVAAPAAAPQAPVKVEVQVVPAPPEKKVVRVQAPRPAPVVQREIVESTDDAVFRRTSTGTPGNDNGIDVYASRPNRTASVPPVCADCGTVENVREIATKGEGSGLGAVAGGVLGGLLGNQTGRGKGKDVMTVLGAVGGAFGGHQVEKMVRTEKQYEVTVRFDDGSVRSFNQTTPQWQSGSRVRLYNGALVSL